MGKIKLADIEFRKPNGQGWKAVENEHKILITGKDGTEVPIIVEENAPEPNVHAEDDTVESITYLDKYHTKRFDGQDITLSVKKYKDIEVNCEFIKKQASKVNAERKEILGQEGYLVKNNNETFDFFFIKSGSLININSTREDLISWFVPDPKSKGLYIIRLIAGAILSIIGLVILTSNIMGIVAIIIGIMLIYFNWNEIKKMDETKCL